MLHLQQKSKNVYIHSKERRQTPVQLLVAVKSMDAVKKIEIN